MVIIKFAQAIANVIIFLEYSPEDILDEDASIEALEQLGADLQALDPQSQQELAEGFRLIASSYTGEIREFVARLPYALGIGEEE